MKSPWSLIGWLLAGLLALILSLGLFYLGLSLGWNPWLAPAILWLPLALAAAIRAVAWLLARPQVPKLPAIDPSNPFSGQWEAIKSGLADGAWELYLVVGDDDESKSLFLSRALGVAEYRAAPAGPEGLALWAAGGRAWLNVPAALWRDEASGAAVGGDWGQLVKLLPGFPGPLAGLMVLSDPKKIYENPEIEGQILARKLSVLGKIPGPPPPWWLVLYPLENLDSGQRLAAALKHQGAGADMWRRPFGLFLKSGLSQGQAFLCSRLEKELEQIDCWPSRPVLAGEILAFGHELKQLPLDYFSAEFSKNPKTSSCDGLFLALAGADCPGQFNELLLQNLIPARRAAAEPLARRRSGAFLRGAIGLACAAVLASLAVGYWQGSRALSLAAELFPLLRQLEARPAPNPHISSLAVATDMALDVERQASALASLYTAPKDAAAAAHQDLAALLRLQLPRSYAQSAAFMAALTTWADGGPARVFEYKSGQVTVPAFARLAGRTKVADLTRKWGAIEESFEAGRLMSLYDHILFTLWRQKAEESAAALDAALEGEALAGLEFLQAAAAELAFQSPLEKPDWLKAAADLALLDNLGDLGDPEEDGWKLAALLKKLRGGGLARDPEALEKLIAAAGAWQDYEAALYSLAPLGESREALAALAAELFSGSPPPPERASLAALERLGNEALSALKASSPIASLSDQKIFARLFLSPIARMRAAATLAAASALEEEWRRTVLLPAQGLPEPEKLAFLMGEDGAVAAFKNGPARPYLEVTPRGYRPREVFEKFPWSSEFLDFLKHSQQLWQEAANNDGFLDISARLRPVRAEGVWVKSHPLGVTVEMLCGEEDFWAESFNQPSTFKARWSAQTCGPLDITVTFRDFTLTKSYEGPEAFLEFLEAASFGEITLTPEDFPNDWHLLAAAGAEALTLSLDVDKVYERINALTNPPPRLTLPASITVSRPGR